MKFASENATPRNPVWVVRSVEPREDYTLLITFERGDRRIYDARPLLEKPLYAPLCHLPFFLGAKAEYGSVSWSDDIDIAPEHLFEHSSPFLN